MYEPCWPKVFSSSFRFILIPMLWVYGHYKFVILQILTSKGYPLTEMVNKKHRIQWIYEWCCRLPLYTYRLILVRHSTDIEICGSGRTCHFHLFAWLCMIYTMDLRERRDNAWSWWEAFSLYLNIVLNLNSLVTQRCTNVESTFIDSANQRQWELTQRWYIQRLLRVGNV